MKNKTIPYTLAAIAILAGIVFVICGMSLYRAVWLILCGAFGLLSSFFDYRRKETPKGLNYWLKKILSQADFLSAICLAFFISKVSADNFDVYVLCIVLLYSILGGTFDYFAHKTDCNGSDFEAKERQRKEYGELYDKVVEEMAAEKRDSE